MIGGMGLFRLVFSVIFLYVSCVKCVPSLDKKDFVSDFAALSKGFQKREVSSTESACDCGPGSKRCKLENGEKICDCKYKYRQVDGVCQPYCEKEKHWMCDNGAECVNESCQCLPGTRGPFCKNVDECAGNKGVRKCGSEDVAFCTFDEQALSAVCRCRIYEFEFYAPNKTCIECDCNEKYGNCSLVDGVKTCKCEPGNALKRVDYGTKIECAPCDCGENGINCSYPIGEGDDFLWKKVCHCIDGYAQYRDDGCYECNCGPHGRCSFPYNKRCDCDKGYSTYLSEDQKEMYCKECDCGGNGNWNCSFKEGVKMCKCATGYADKDGSCMECDCGQNGDCSFDGEEKKCKCNSGYEENNGICTDLDECSNPDTCLYDSYCVNTEGSHKCHCKEGYEPYTKGGDPMDVDRYGCIDIDECENEEMCHRENTVCNNSPGSYTCGCRLGFEPVSPHESAIPAGCQVGKFETEEKSLSSNTLAIVLVVVFVLCAIGLITVIYLKKRAPRDSRGTGTQLRNLE